MHRNRILAQISLIIFLLNIVLAAPIVVQEIHEARNDELVVAEDATVMSQKWRKLEAASSDRLTAPRSYPPDAQDAVASPQHSSSSDGSTSSGYPAPHLSSDESVSGYSWMLDRPPRLSPHGPAPPHDWASPHASSSGSSQFSNLAIDVAFPEPVTVHGLALAPEPEIVELPPSPQHTGLDHAATETHSPPDRFTPSLQSLSGSGGSVPSHASISSAGSVTSVPLHHSTPQGPAQILTPHVSPPPSSPPTETLPITAEFFNNNLMKKLKIAAGVATVGGTAAIATIMGLKIKHQDRRDD